MDEQDKERTRERFADAVNMTPRELEDWLARRESTEVGDASGRGEESTGHANGRGIVGVLRTNHRELTGDQYELMRQVVGYVQRHEAQRPSGYIPHSRWRYSLMNWGHDPCKDCDAA